MPAAKKAVATSLLRNRIMASPNDTFTKFDFDNDFFEVVATPGQVAAPMAAKPVTKDRAPRTFKEAEEQGYNKGLLQGKIEGQTETEQRLTVQFNQQAEQLKQALTILEQAHVDASKDLENQLLGLLRHSLIKIVGHAAHNYTDEILTSHLKDLLEEARNTQNLTLKIHPDATAIHKELVAGNTNIKISPESTLGPADCALEWQSGGLDKRLSSLLERLDKLLLNAGAIQMDAPPETTTPTAVSAETTPSQSAADAVKARADDLIDPNEELVAELKPE